MLFPCFLRKRRLFFYYAEAVVQRCSVKKVFSEISQNSQKNTCARVSLLMKLQASCFFWIPVFLIVEVSFLNILSEFHEIKLNVMKYTLNSVSWNSLKEIFQCILALCNSQNDIRFLTGPIYGIVTGKPFKSTNSKRVTNV